MSDYAPFEAPPPSNVYHIIWNILLADKQVNLTAHSLKENNVGHIVAILPSKEEFLKLADTNIPATVLEYGDVHEPVIDKVRFQEIGKFIDNLARDAKDDSERNVLIFCNNGYQRSIPFLVYYLTQFPS